MRPKVVSGFRCVVKVQLARSSNPEARNQATFNVKWSSIK